MWVPSLGWEDSLEKGMANHSSILAWRIPWTEEPGGPRFIELQSPTRVKQLNTQSRSEGVGLERLLVLCGAPWGLCCKYRCSSVCPGSRGWGDDLSPMEMTIPRLPQPFPWAWSNYMWTDVHIRTVLLPSLHPQPKTVCC